MSVADNAILRVVSTCSILGTTKTQNVFHARHTTGSAQDDSDVIDAAVEWIEAILTEMVAVLANDLSLTGVEVYEYSHPDIEPIGESAGTFVGTANDANVPSGLCMMLEAFKERTGHADRKYISGLTVGSLLADSWAAGTLAVGADAVLVWINEFTASNGVKLTGCYLNRSTGATAFYTGGSVASKIAYQRRRKPGVGLT